MRPCLLRLIRAGCASSRASLQAQRSNLCTDTHVFTGSRYAELGLLHFIRNDEHNRLFASLREIWAPTLFLIAWLFSPGIYQVLNFPDALNFYQLKGINTAMTELPFVKKFIGCPY
jgi:hypothetical protein